MCVYQYVKLKKDIQLGAVSHSVLYSVQKVCGSWWYSTEIAIYNSGWLACSALENGWKSRRW